MPYVGRGLQMVALMEGRESEEKNMDSITMTLSNTFPSHFGVGV